MNFSTTFFINAGSLFDFDLTFVAELTLFVLLALVVTFRFVGPVSKEIDARAEFINYTLRKSTILLTFGYERLSECVDLLTTEINEMNRQVKLTRNFTNTNFEKEVITAQQKNAQLLSKLKGILQLNRHFFWLISTMNYQVLLINFLLKKFQS